MTCPEAETIARLASGHLSGTDEQNVRAHLRDCPSCAAVFEDINETWDALAAWQLDQPVPDIKDRVLQAAAAGSNRPRRAVWRIPPGVRAAASIALAIGLGIAAGHLVPRPTSDQPAATHTNLEALERALTLVGQFSDSPTGLSIGLGDGHTKTGEGPS